MHDDLIRQALRLANLDAKRPKQANLRRAESAAYYGLFHFLSDQYCRQIMGTTNGAQPFRKLLARGLMHGEMKDACKTFSGGTLPKSATNRLPQSFKVASPIKTIARAFVEAQERRHLADYDLSELFLRSDVLSHVKEIETAIKRYKKCKDKMQRKFFLGCLISRESLKR